SWTSSGVSSPPRRTTRRRARCWTSWSGGRARCGRCARERGGRRRRFRPAGRRARVRPGLTRVLVIGGGIAGCMAALAAVQAGAEVMLVARAPGATALYAGGMEVASDYREMRTLAAAQPYHPFVRLGLNDFEVVTLLDEVCYRLQSALARAGLRLAGAWRTTGWYADVHGGVRPAQLVPESVQPGELTGLQGKRVAVVGVSAVGDYDAVA